jgi:GNAT superfamily N-acetyltransferase
MKTGPEFSEDHLLADGTRVTLRHIRPGDATELRRGFERLSRESRYRRFFSGISELSEETLRYLTDVDGVDHVAIVAVGVSPDLKSEAGYGVGRFVRTKDDPTAAEAALTVVDDMQHKGIGRLLALSLAEAARERGITHIRGETLASNTPVRQMLDEVGAHVRVEAPTSLAFEVALPKAAPDEPDSALRRLVRAMATSASEIVRGLAPPGR